MKPAGDRRTGRENVVIEEPSRHDDARVPGFGRCAGAAVTREQQRVEIIRRAGQSVRTIQHRRDRAARTSDVLGAIGLIAQRVGAAGGQSKKSEKIARSWSYFVAAGPNAMLKFTTSVSDWIGNVLRTWSSMYLFRSRLKP